MERERLILLGWAIEHLLGWAIEHPLMLKENKIIVNMLPYPVY
jgi:hypothetical protein